MDLLGAGILFLFSNESVQDFDGGGGGIKNDIFMQARWPDKDSHSELLQYSTQEVNFSGNLASV